MQMLRLTLRQLQVFQAVAREGGFVRAGEVLHLTQPAISMQIRQLEDAIGMPLLDRSGRRVALTELGSRFLEHATRVLGEVRDATFVMEEFRGLSRGQVTVGMVSTAKYFLLRLLAGFTRQHAGVELRIVSGNRNELIQTLDRNEIDLAVMGRPPQRLGLESVMFAPHPFVFIGAGDHCLAGVGSADPVDLRHETLLMREMGSGTRLLADEWFRKALIVPARQLVLGGNETIKQAVIAGMGISLLSRHTLTLEMEHRELAILPIDGTPVLRSWHVAYRGGRRLSPAAKALYDFVLHQGGAFLSTAFGPAGD